MRETAGGPAGSRKPKPTEYVEHQRWLLLPDDVLGYAGYFLVVVLRRHAGQPQHGNLARQEGRLRVREVKHPSVKVTRFHSVMRFFFTSWRSTLIHGCIIRSESQRVAILICPSGQLWHCSQESHEAQKYFSHSNTHLKFHVKSFYCRIFTYGILVVLK